MALLQGRARKGTLRGLGGAQLAEGSPHGGRIRALKRGHVLRADVLLARGFRLSSCWPGRCSFAGWCSTSVR
eukprot:5182817-Pyramimonas_sp.AAC.1